MPGPLLHDRILKGVYLVSLFAFPLSGEAQQFLVGRVHKNDSEDVLLAVTVENLALHKYDQSDMGGNFRIPASPGDRVVFSIAGYRPDTVIISGSMLADRYEEYLTPNIVQLATVKVGDLNSYEVDSLQRIQDYSMFHDSRPSHVVDPSGGYDGGFGIHVSPSTFFGRKGRQQRRLKRRLQSDEKEFYISYRFSRTYVWKLTRLNEDSLTLFMERYRPAYKFCRSASEADMLNYVNLHFKEFMKRPGVTR
jgi:hypothetical protein